MSTTNTCRWLIRPDWHGRGTLEINGVAYGIRPVSQVCTRKLLGYRVTNLATGAVYEIETDWDRWECSCPDHCYRRPERGCKHIRAIRAALAKHDRDIEESRKCALQIA